VNLRGQGTGDWTLQYASVTVYNIAIRIGSSVGSGPRARHAVLRVCRMMPHPGGIRTRHCFLTMFTCKKSVFFCVSVSMCANCDPRRAPEVLPDASAMARQQGHGLCQATSPSYDAAKMSALACHTYPAYKGQLEQDHTKAGVVCSSSLTSVHTAACCHRQRSRQQRSGYSTGSNPISGGKPPGGTRKAPQPATRPQATTNDTVTNAQHS
jgi:hypothetical protein